MCYMHHSIKDFLGGHLPDGTCPYAENNILPGSKLFESLYGQRKLPDIDEKGVVTTNPLAISKRGFEGHTVAAILLGDIVTPSVSNPLGSAPTLLEAPRGGNITGARHCRSHRCEEDTKPSVVARQPPTYHPVRRAYRGPLGSEA